jgi:protein-tyrosine phosphatase
MAEGILKSMLAHRGEDGVEVSSAGISGLDNYPAADNAVEAARHWGVDISDHKARSMSRKIIDRADLILGMSPEHVEYILRVDSGAADKTFLIKAFPKPYSPAQEGVDDPIGGLLEQYNNTYLELDEALRRAEAEILSRASAKRKDA